MHSFMMVLHCPRCQAKVKPINIGKPIDGGTEINAVVRCTKGGCRMEWALHVRLMEMGVYQEGGEIHGTNRAFKRHVDKGEPVCDECHAFRNRQEEDRTAARSADRHRAKERIDVT